MDTLLIVLPVPRHPLVDGRVTLWLAALCRRYRNVEIAQPCGDSCDANRNAAIAAALAREPDVRHIFFLDADTVPPADAVERLLSLRVPVACGVTPIRRRGAAFWNIRAVGEKSWWPRATPLPTEPFCVQHVGGTTVLVERQAIQAVGYPWFFREYVDRPSADLEYVQRSGDVFFADRLRACGYPILCDPSVRCHHYKVTDLLEEESFSVCSSVGSAAGPSPSPARPEPPGEFERLCREIQEQIQEKKDS